MNEIKYLKYNLTYHIISLNQNLIKDIIIKLITHYFFAICFLKSKIYIISDLKPSLVSNNISANKKLLPQRLTIVNNILSQLLSNKLNLLKNIII